MMERLPLTIEILAFEGGHPVVLDRVIGGSVYLEEAKRIGQHLLSVSDAGTGYRVLSHDHELIVVWKADGGNETGQDKTQG